MSKNEENFLFRLADMLSVRMQAQSSDSNHRLTCLCSLRLFNFETSKNFLKSYYRDTSSIATSVFSENKCISKALDWQTGVATCKKFQIAIGQAIHQYKQLRQVEKFACKIQKTLSLVEKQAESKDWDGITEHLYQLKRLNKDYSVVIDNYGSSLSLETSLSSCSGKSSANQIDLLHTSDYHIPVPELRHTEHIIICPL